MKIAVRMDDITPDMDWRKFDRFKALLDQYGIKPLIGVVPDNKDANLCKDAPKADFWERIIQIQQQGWIIAMHGYHHVYTTAKGGCFPLNRQSEFAGLSFETQSRMLREARAILEAHNISTDFFMAPSHSYDANTIKALKQNGFFRITDGFGTQPYVWQGMTFYPISYSRSRSLASNRKGAVTFVVHVNTMEDAEFAYYEKVFQTADMIPFSEYLYYPTVRGTLLHHLGEYLLAKAKYVAVHTVHPK